MAEQLEEGGNGWLLACTSKRVLDRSLYGTRGNPTGRNPRELSLDSARG